MSGAAGPRRTLARLLAPALSTPAWSADLTELDELDWDPILGAADEDGLLPALRVALSARDELPPVPDGVRAEAERRLPPGQSLPAVVLDEALAANRLRVADLLDQATTLLAALDEAGIPSAPLKGVDAVLAGRYPEPAARTMTDVDVLVPFARAEDAEQLLADLGYDEVDAPPATHQLPPRRRSDRAGSVELHTDLMTEWWGALIDPAEVLARAEPTVDGSPGLRLDRTDSALHLVAHAQLHDDAHLLWSAPLRALHETALLLDGDEPVDWDALGTAFAKVGRRRALDAHLELTRLLFGVRLPHRPCASGRAAARVELGLLDRAELQAQVAQARYLPRGLSSKRMYELYGVDGGPALWSARGRHLLAGARRRLGR